MTPQDNLQDAGASASPSGSRPTDQAQLHGPDAPRVDPSRKQKWAAFDAHYAKWAKRDLAPAFVQGISEHSWSVQYLVPADPPKRSWFHRLLNDPPILAIAEPFYNGWPGDRRGWMRFPSKEAARDFYQMCNRFISMDEYRSRPHEPLTMECFDLDEQGNFASAIEARQRTDPEEGLDPKGESATGAAGDAQPEPSS